MSEPVEDQSETIKRAWADRPAWANRVLRDQGGVTVLAPPTLRPISRQSLEEPNLMEPVHHVTFRISPEGIVMGRYKDTEIPLGFYQE